LRLNRQKLETAGAVLRLVGNCVLTAAKMSPLIDQSPGRSFQKGDFKKSSKAAGVPHSGNSGPKSHFLSVPMTVVGIEMAVGMRMPRAIRVLMLMLVEYDLQTPPEGVGNSAEGFYAWDMVATFKARDHGLRHL
jgi:hypothetical protein